MPHLTKDFTEDTQYTLGYHIQNDYLALKSNNTLYKIYKNNPNNTQSPQDSSNNTTQQNNTDSIYFRDSKDFENLKNTLYPTSQQIYQEVKMWVEVEKPYYIDSEGYLQGLNIVKYPITRLESSLVNGFAPKAIVLHGTGSTTAKSALATWSNPNNARVGTHFLIDTDGTIYQCASLHKYTQHVGNIRSKAKETGTWNEKEKKYIVGLGWNPEALSNYEKTKSYPNRYPTSSDSIGIEVVGNMMIRQKDTQMPQQSN